VLKVAVTVVPKMTKELTITLIRIITMMMKMIMNQIVMDLMKMTMMMAMIKIRKGDRGIPSASKSVIETLKIVEKSEVSEMSEVCAICKDKVFNSEEEVVKHLPCGHMHHEKYIVPWLGLRNTCPICRYELETSDVEYEEESEWEQECYDRVFYSRTYGDGGEV
nr:E3 ubiquitin-protein ligase CIP8-like [Tanacetum cinerariifolium]